jgi:hypothetical protein
VLEREIASYQTRLLEELVALQLPERRDEPVSPHPNRAKKKALKARGEQLLRTTLWRFAGVDLTRIDGVSTGAAQVILTEVGQNCTRCFLPTNRSLQGRCRRSLRHRTPTRPPRLPNAPLRTRLRDIGEKAYEQRFQSRRLAAITETARSLGYTLVPTAGPA